MLLKIIIFTLSLVFFYCHGIFSVYLFEKLNNKKIPFTNIVIRPHTFIIAFMVVSFSYLYFIFSFINDDYNQLVGYSLVTYVILDFVINKFVIKNNPE